MRIFVGNLPFRTGSNELADLFGRFGEVQSADVVLYDRLVAPAIVDMARRDAERIYVGKRRSEHAVPQPEINRQLLERGLTVSDADVRKAMRFAFANLKLVVEPGGAAALAAVLSGKIETAGKTTVVVISGGNVDRELFAEIQREGSG